MSSENADNQGAKAMRRRGGTAARQDESPVIAWLKRAGEGEER
jgi:hypothetical protein